MSSPDLSWGDFAAQKPDIASQGTRLINQFGIGLGFIATVRKDGGPRMHPCCPLLQEEALYVFILATSPKRYDLDRDGRYALHSNPSPDNDDEFYISGSAHLVSDSEHRARISALMSHKVDPSERLYELRIQRALYTTWKNPRQPNTEPVYTRWQNV